MDGSGNLNFSSLQIKRGALMSYTAIFFNMAAGVLYTPWMIRQIGQSDYALYTLALTLISFFTIDFGLGQAVSRFLSKYDAEKNDSAKKEFLGITFKLYLLIDAIILAAMVGVYIFSGRIYAELTPAELENFRIVFLIAAFYAVGSFPFKPLDGILISHERFAFLKFADLMHRVLTVSTMIIVLVLGYRLYALVTVNAMMGFITIGLKIYYIMTNHLVKINIKAWDGALIKEIASFSGWTAIIMFSQRLIFNITPTVLAAFAGSTQIAVFAIASTMEGYVWTFAAALNGLFLPKVTKMLLQKEGSLKIENLMIKVGRIQLALIGLLYVGFLTVGKEFLVLWLNEGFLASYNLVILMITPALITVTQEIANTALVAKNQLKYHAFGALTAGSISIALSLILSQKWGALGAAIAILVGNGVVSILFMNAVYKRVLKIDIVRFFRACHFKMAVPLGITAVAGFLLQSVFPGGTWPWFLAKVLVITLCYGLLVWFLSLNDFEKNLCRDYYLKLIRRV